MTRNSKGTARPLAQIAMLLLALLSVLNMAAQPSQGVGPAGERPIRIVFRYDDYSARSDTAFETWLFSRFAELGMPLTVGVIPFVAAEDTNDPRPQETLPLPEEKLALLRQVGETGMVEVALHGYAHHTLYDPDSGSVSEFAGLDASAQRQRIQAGLEYLQGGTGQTIETFVPPWNSYDVETAAVIESLGLRILSAGSEGEVPHGTSLQMLPTMINLPELPEMVSYARKHVEWEPLITVLFHASDVVEVNPEKGIYTYDSLDNLLTWIAEQPDVQTMTLASATQSGDLGWERYDRLQRFSIGEPLGRLAPPFVRQSYVRAVRTYPGLQVLQGLEWRYAALLVLFYLGVMAAGYLGGLGTALVLRFMARRHQAQAVITLALPVGVTLLSLALTAYILRDGQVYFPSASAMALVWGASLGSWTARWERTIQVARRWTRRAVDPNTAQ